MRYNENDGDEINGQIVITEEIDENPIFEVSCVTVGNLSVETLRANYDITVLGSINAEKIDVAGNLSCYGDCNCEEIAIQGSCTIDGILNVQSGFIGDTLIAKEICAETMEVKSTVMCINMECNDEVICNKNVLIAEGLSGSGSLESNFIMCGEYSLLDDTSDLFIADMAKDEGLTTSVETKKSEKNELEDIIDKARNYTSQKFSSELSEFVNDNELYKREYVAFRKLLLVENITVCPSIKTYVDIIDTLNKKYQIISYTKLFGKVKARFESFDYEDIDNSILPAMTQKEFAKILYILSYKGQGFDSNIRESIISKLYSYAGMDVDIFNRKENQNEFINENNEVSCDKEFEVGDEIIVISGIWKNTSGIINKIDIKKKTLTINVSLFGIETPIAISFKECCKL